MLLQYEINSIILRFCDVYRNTLLGLQHLVLLVEMYSSCKLFDRVSETEKNKNKQTNQQQYKQKE